VRAAGVEVHNVRPLLAAMNRMGMPLYGCQSPDGYKNTEDVWLNPDALAQRIGFASGIGLGRSPLATVIDDTVDNDPYASGTSRNSDAMDPPGKAAALAEATPLDVNAVLATVGEQVSAQTRARISASGPSPFNAAQVLGSPDFMRR
jgi:Protein of unknown function (DUF1800)